MKPAVRRALAGLAALVALGLAAAVWLLMHRTAPVSPQEQIPAAWATARVAPMHQAHLGAKGVACADCHASGFAERPGTAACARCHAAESTRFHAGTTAAPTTCFSCHAFRPGTTSACGDCHTRASGALPALPHHGGDTPCAGCHAMHPPEAAVLPDCTGCHRDVSARHGAFAAGPTDAGPADAGPDDAGPDDGGAAGLTALRDAGVAWAWLASSTAPRSRAEIAGAKGAVCTTCHAPHRGKADARDGCVGCHTRSKASPPQGFAGLARTAPVVEARGRGAAGHPACVTCHAPHEAEARAALACEGCHEDHRGVVGGAGHRACTGCHAPHAPGEAAASCARCHAAVHVLGAGRTKAHTDCIQCHDVHRPATSPADACARCHADVHPRHGASATNASATKASGAKASATTACTSCHEPHPRRDSVAVACASCHHEAKSDTAFHGGAVPCTLCHKPHVFTQQGVGAALCGTCHQGKQAAVAARPGHRACADCHGSPHAPVAAPGCAACHGAEASTAPRGHARCTQCHEAHGGDLGEHRACGSCHAEKGAALHGALAGGCTTCHRAHGPRGVPRPPTCGSCHAPARLPGLHRGAAHGECRQCHTAHEGPKSDRATCTGSCHQDRRNHQPDAPVCRGCHAFGD